MFELKKIRIILLFAFAFYFISVINGQASQDCVQGIWKGAIWKNKLYKNENAFEVLVFKDSLQLSFVVDSVGLLKGHFSINQFGFFLEGDRITSGQEIPKEGDNIFFFRPGQFDCCVSNWIECGSNRYLIFSHSTQQEFKALLNLENQTIISLAETNWRDSDLNIFEFFFSKSIKSICVNLLPGFDSINGAEIGTLNLGDVVEVLEYENDWVKIKHLATGSLFWTYMGCLE